MTKIIGIGGASNSGKSKLSGLIKSNLLDKKATIVCQDDYIHPQYEIPRIKGHIDWESTESINFVAFRKAIIEVSEVSDIVIAEGFLAFYDSGINSLYDKKIFIQITKEEFYKEKEMIFAGGKNRNGIWIISGKAIFELANQNSKPKHTYLSMDLRNLIRT